MVIPPSLVRFFKIIATLADGKKDGSTPTVLTERKPEMGRVDGPSVGKKAVTCEFNLSSAKLDSMSSKDR